jgi:hypothetical protein
MNLYNVLESGSNPGGALQLVKVGQYLNNGSWRWFRPVIFSDGTTTPPLDVNRPPPSVDSLPLGAQIFGWFEAALGTVAGLWALAQLYFMSKIPGSFERKLPSQLGILAIGSISMALSIIGLTFGDEDAGCMTFMWLFALGIAAILSGLLAKSVYSLRVWRRHKRLLLTRRRSLSSTVKGRATPGTRLSGLLTCNKNSGSKGEHSIHSPVSQDGPINRRVEETLKQTLLEFPNDASVGSPGLGGFLYPCVPPRSRFQN